MCVVSKRVSPLLECYFHKEKDFLLTIIYSDVIGGCNRKQGRKDIREGGREEGFSWYF